MTDHDDDQFSSAMPSAAEALDLPPGHRVGDYEIVETIGRGGFGTVFRAVHPLIDKVVAIKVLHPAYSAQPQVVSRFMAEARAVNRIQHRNIIDIFGFGTIEEELHYYVMEYLHGESLEAFVKRHGRLSIEITLGLLRPIARALHAAHEKGIAHRDLKTDNVFLAQDHDGNVEPKLLDFGIAKLLHDESAPSGHRTRDGMPMGTPGYMSPEQCLGQAVDHRTDVYAFGILAYRMLTGTLPFSGDSYMRIMLAHIHAPPPGLRELVPDLPEGVEQSILGMLAKEPAERPQTMRAALQSMESAALAAGVPLPAENSRITLPGGRQRLTSTHVTPPVSGMDDLATLESSSAPDGAAATMDAGAQRRATPAQLAARAQPVSMTDMAVEKPPAARRGRGAMLIVAALALAGIGALAARPWERAAGETQTVVSAVAAPDPTAPEPPAPEPAATPPALVAVTIEGPPAGTEVYGPAGLLGVAPGVIQLPRGDTEVMLTFKADGYVATTATVTPAAATTLAVALEPRTTTPAAPAPPARPASGAKPRKPRDPDDRRNVLESPF
jgi:serine/threonine-protein kinase